MKKYLLSILTLFILYNISYSYEKPITALFLRLPVGAKASAMGGAFTSMSDGVNSLYWNPAGLSHEKEKEFTFMHNSYIQDLKQEYIAYSQFVEQLNGTLGVNISIFDHGDFERTLMNTSTTFTSHGSFDARDIAIGVGYGNCFSEKVRFGAMCKYVVSKYDDAKASAFAFDLGWLYVLESMPLNIGFVVQNIGGDLQFDQESENMPLTTKMGFSYKYKINKEISLIQSIDNIYLIEDGKIYNLAYGIEFGFKQNYFLRLGYDDFNESGNGLTLGAGVILYKISVDYAFADYDILGNSHKFSLNYKF